MEKAKITRKATTNPTEYLEKEICLNGWVNRIRNIGKIVFFDLEYANKQTQIVIKEKGLIKEAIKGIKTGDLITVKGKYQRKKISPSVIEETISNELLMTSWKIINRTTTLPFEIKDDLEIKEDNKYRYRYLDLRRTKSREIIVYKHKLISHMRNFLQQEDFIEIETPILSQSSPEGAKTFVVPTKTAGYFYTLPQSPQIFKQILMIGGFDKYYQIAKSFRNEDARSNRQPEFLQLDLEMSFIKEEEVFTLIERLIVGILQEVFSVERELISFQRINFDECMNKYGTDKPDLRNPLQVITINKGDKFPITLKSPEEGDHYEELGMHIPLDIYSRDLVQFIKKKVSDSSKYSFFKLEKEKWELVDGIDTVSFNRNSQQFTDGLYLIINEKQNIARQRLLEIRSFCGKFFPNKENPKKFKFLWVVEWPLFKYDQNEKRVISLRHPFTLPGEKDIREIFSNEETSHLFSIKGRAYDLVCNGEELASGSLRIFRRDLQERVFEILGFSKQEIEEHFGYFLKALEFAAPPHGGIALGIERMLAVFLDLKNLKEAVAFPKNIDGSCSLTGAPNKL